MKKILLLLLLSSCITVNICDCKMDNNKEIIWQYEPEYNDPMPINLWELYDSIWFYNDTILYYELDLDTLFFTPNSQDTTIKILKP